MAALKITLFRYDPACDSEPRYQDYVIDPDGPLSVLQAIRYVYHNSDGSLSFRNSDCRRGVCGICSMMIDGRRKEFGFRDRLIMNMALAYAMND